MVYGAQPVVAAQGIAASELSARHEDDKRLLERAASWI
jgi:hypothetical protein